MPDIKIKAKWDNKKNEWNEYPKEKEYGRSFAISNLKSSKEKENINYIFFSPGERVEDHSKDYKTMSIKENRMDRIIEHYEKKEGNYSINMLFMDADAPIKEDAKLFAKIIDKLCKEKETKSVTLVGFSKCGVMNCYVPKFFRKKISYKKTNMINVAAPYEGTILASPKFLWSELTKKLNDKLHSKKVTELVIKKLKKLHHKMSSNSHMDYDIALIDGVEDEQKALYDRSLIPNVFKKDNVKAIKRLRAFKNIVTGIDKKTWKECLKERNKEGFLLCLLNRYLMGHASDGFVNTKSQEKAGVILKQENIRMKSSHHHVTSSKRMTEELLTVIDETIEKGYQKKL